MKKHIIWFVPLLLLLCLSFLAFYFKLGGDFFKQYGAAIGPSLAFMLGIITFSLKYQFDENNEKRKADEAFLELKQLIKVSEPPEYIDNVIHKGDRISVNHKKGNSGNIAIFYQRVLLIKKCLDDILDDKHSLMSSQNMVQLADMKWWLDYLLREVEEYRGGIKEIELLFDKANKSNESDDILVANSALDDYVIGERSVILAISIGYENLRSSFEKGVAFSPEYEYPNINTEHDS